MRKSLIDLFLNDIAGLNAKDRARTTRLWWFATQLELGRRGLLDIHCRSITITTDKATAEPFAGFWQNQTDADLDALHSFLQRRLRVT